jgi:hypothetical protein
MFPLIGIFCFWNGLGDFASNLEGVLTGENHILERIASLLYGRLYLPSSTLEALYMRRISPTQQLRLCCVSDSRLKNGGTVSRAP